MAAGEQRCIIISAPSGAGKTSIIRKLLPLIPQLAFSISATSRPQRDGEVHGEDYYFLSTEAFKSAIAAGDLLEWEEVYPGKYYGTLKSEVNRLQMDGKAVIFDVDVVGGLRLKKILGPSGLAIFIAPPNILSLESRLRQRQTETEESLQIRVGKAATELKFKPEFDRSIGFFNGETIGGRNGPVFCHL